MNSLNQDARGFVEGVVTYLRQEGKTPSTVPKVHTLLQKVSAQARKEKEAYVYSCVVLSNSEKQQISDILSALIGHTVHLEAKIDQSLIAGLRIQVGDWVVDTSLKGQLESMNQVLL